MNKEELLNDEEFIQKLAAKMAPIVAAQVKAALENQQQNDNKNNKQKQFDLKEIFEQMDQIVYKAAEYRQLDTTLRVQETLADIMIEIIKPNNNRRRYHR